MLAVYTLMNELTLQLCRHQYSIYNHIRVYTHIHTYICTMYIHILYTYRTQQWWRILMSAVESKKKEKGYRKWWKRKKAPHIHILIVYSQSWLWLALAYTHWIKYSKWQRCELYTYKICRYIQKKWLPRDNIIK